MSTASLVFSGPLPGEQAFTLPTLQKRGPVEPVRTDSEVLNKALGPGPLRLLSCLLDDRAAGRESHRTLAGWGRKLGADARVVKAWMADLAAAGLQAYGGVRGARQPRLVAYTLDRPDRVIQARQLVPVRAATAEVRGGVVISSSESRAWAEERLKISRNWGGKRAGAGRKRKVVEVHDGNSSSADSESLGNNQVGLPRSDTSISGEAPPFGRGCAEAAHSETLALPPTLDVDDQAQELRPSQVPTPDLGAFDPTRESYAARRARLTKLAGRGLPPKPRDEMARLGLMVSTPPPPPLDPALTDQAAGRHLAGVYAAACERLQRPGATPLAFCDVCFDDHATGQHGRARALRERAESSCALEAAEAREAAVSAAVRPRRAFGGRLSRALERTLAQFAGAMRLSGVLPAAWVAFSFDVWRMAGRTDGPPTMAWTFSLNRLRDARGWYEQELERYTGSTFVVSDELRRLQHAHDAMWQDMLRENPQDGPSTWAVIDRHFPGDAWERAVERAAAGQRRLRRDIDEAVARGAILWGS